MGKRRKFTLYIRRNQFTQNDRRGLKKISLKLLFDAAINNPNLGYNYYLQKSRLYTVEKKYDSACKYLGFARIIQSSLTKNDAIVFSQAEQKVEVRQYLSAIKFPESEEDKQSIVRNFIIMRILLFLINAVQFIFRHRIRKKISLKESIDLEDLDKIV